jgi:hypothetical protein
MPKSNSIKVIIPVQILDIFNIKRTAQIKKAFQPVNSMVIFLMVLENYQIIYYI